MRRETDLMGHERQFPGTSWDLIRPRPNLQSLDVLVRRYWKPLYFFVRRHGFDVETSKDIVQAFMANMLTRDRFAKADPRLGKFRSFILAAISNFIKDWSKTSARLKRGGGARVLSLDVSSVESGGSRQIESAEETPERRLNREWARSLLDQARSELTGSPTHLAAFDLYLDGSSYDEIASKTGLSETAAKVAVHRLRGKLRQILIARIAETVGTDEDLEAELSEFVSLVC